LDVGPVEEQRCARVRRQLPALARLVAAEEREPALVGALQQDHAHRRPTVGRRRRKGDLGTVHPLVEERERVGGHASASAGSSWIDGIGDGRSQARPSNAPSVAIHSVGRTPIVEPSTPPSAVPTGRTPLFTTMNAPETRERSGGGTVPALIVPAMMSSSIRPTPDVNSATKRHVSTTQCGPP